MTTQPDTKDIELLEATIRDRDAQISRLQQVARNAGVPQSLLDGAIDTGQDFHTTYRCGRRHPFTVDKYCPRPMGHPGNCIYGVLR